MLENFKLNRIARRLKRCKVVPKTNAQLRNEMLVCKGKVMKPLDYIEYVAKQFPPVAVNDVPIDYVKRMRELYYRNGLKGLNLYVDYVRLRTKIEKEKANKAFRSKAKTKSSALSLNNTNLLLVLLLSVTFINGAGIPASSIGSIKPMDGQIVRFDGYRSPALKVTDTSIGPVFKKQITMVQLGDRGNLIMVAKPHIGGEEWLLRIKSILKLVQNVDEKAMSKQDIYYAIDVVNDMLPDESTADKLCDIMKEEKSKAL